MSKDVTKDARPIAVFRFKSQKAKSEFLGQLSDGWGENYCDLEWAWKAGFELDEAPIIDVRVTGRDDKECS